MINIKLQYQNDCCVNINEKIRLIELNIVDLQEQKANIIDETKSKEDILVKLEANRLGMRDVFS
jgi:hypothetical protein